MSAEITIELEAPLKEKQVQELMDRQKAEANYSILKLGFFDSISFKLHGYVKLGSLAKGSKAHKDVYAFNCQMHGLQVVSPSGWSNELICPTCLKELKAELEREKSRKDDLNKIESVNVLNKYLTKNNEKDK